MSKVSSLTPIFRGSGSVPCWFPSYQSGDQEVSLVQVSCLCGFHQPGMDPFAHPLIRPPSLQLDFGSVQGLAVGVCFCFHQLLDEGNRMAYKSVIISRLSSATEKKLEVSLA